MTDTRTPPLRIVSYALFGAAWIAIACVALLGDDPRGRCAEDVYRDPVTGRPSTSANAKVQSDGKIACRR
jgi:hypothetical protein